MERLHYLNFELKIERKGRKYAVRVQSPTGEASNIFKLPFSETERELLIIKMGRNIRIIRSIHSDELEAAHKLGGGLFKAVFGGEVLGCLRSSLDEISEGTGLRLNLHLQEVAELADLPWEFLFDQEKGRFFAQSAQTPIVRYIEMPEKIKPLIIDLPLNILVMTSSPADYQRPDGLVTTLQSLDVEREKSSLKKALDPLSIEGKVNVKWLEKPTLTALLHCLREGTKYHIFHFIGHGGFDRKAIEGMLVIENELGHGWQAEAHRIGTLLHDHQSLRLAVLNSCEGARNSRTDPFAGVATTLIRQGIPAVVAMQFEISDKAAITFAGEFYSALAGGYPVDAAVAEARKAVYIQPNDIEWGTPVLYLRSPDGVLFNPAQSIKESHPSQPPEKEKGEQESAQKVKEKEEAERKEREIMAGEEEEKKAKEDDLRKEQENQKNTLIATAQQLYNNGKYAEAISKWDEVLVLISEDEKAKEGRKKAEDKIKNFCPKCGKENVHRREFCRKCGTRLYRTGMA